MSELMDLTEDLEEFILRRPIFETAKVYRREEMEGDEQPETCVLYIYPENPRAEESDFSLDMRVYPVTVVAKFQIHGVDSLEDMDARNAVLIQRTDYHQELMGLKARYNVRTDNTTNCYVMEIRDTNLRVPKPENVTDPPGTYRVSVTFDMHTVEKYDEV